MGVYVDDVRHKFGRMIMCHLWADTLEELLDMVDRIGVQRKWIQGHKELSFGKHRYASWVHFDISLGKKAEAITAGAMLTDKYGPSEYMARIRAASDDANISARGKKMLAVIKKCRSQNARSERGIDEQESAG